MSFPPQFEAPTPEELHELLPAYDVLAFIAKGGMGAVYKAHQKSLERDVAIKILPREFGADEDFRKRFEDEAKAMAKLNHPNLISVYDFGEVDGMPYIVMEFVDGKSLHYSAHGKAIDQKDAVRLVKGICEGLAHAHEAGILHRDIKPANILLDPRKRPKIGDFGLARAADDTEGEGVHFGTPDYTAPEVMKNPEAADKRSDVYSTGIILYELLTGRIPEKDYMPASQSEGVDPRFDKIVRRATHPAPTLRYADAGAMGKDVADLERALDKPGAAIVTKAPATNLTAQAPPQGDHQISPPPGPAVPSTPSPPPQVLASTGPNWNLLRNLIIIVVLIGAIYGMYQAYQWRKTDLARQELEQDEKVQDEKQTRIDEMLEKRKQAQREKPEVQPVNVPPEPEPETPRRALERLKPQLAAGERTELPPDSLTRGQSSGYFLIETPMSWHAASSFAEAHGGHLATIPNENEKNWLTSKIPDDATIWLGGGATGRNSWGWVDGSEWTVRRPSAATGNAASLSHLGTIRARPAGDEFPFFIQWRMDGSNPGSLDAQLQRLKETLDTPNPRYPPGILFNESRRFLIVQKSVGWEEAASIARSAQGHLAVPSEQIESGYLLSELTASLPAGEAAWIGGTHNGRAWTWTTGEPWAFADWAPDQPDGDESVDTAVRLVAGPNGGWDDANPDDESAAVAFLIEWSNDRSSIREVAVPTGGADWASLRVKALQLVREAEAEHAQKLKKNGKDLKWDLDFWHRGLRDNEKKAHSAAVTFIKSQVQEDGSITIPDERPAKLPPRGDQIVQDYLRKENEIHAALDQKLENLRANYIAALEEKKAAAEQKGLASQARAIENEISACGTDAATFRSHFGAGR